MGVPGTNYP